LLDQFVHLAFNTKWYALSSKQAPNLSLNGIKHTLSRSGYGGGALFLFLLGLPFFLQSFSGAGMFYVIYVLTILCGTAFGLKIHSPSKGMVVANQAVAVKWSRQNASDPTSVLFLLENLIGGNKTQAGVSNSSDSSAHTTTQMNFPDVGTFRMWAVNPEDPTQSYAMSKNFTVMPNNVAASAGVASSATVDGDGGDSDSSDPDSLPPSNSPGSADPSQSTTPPLSLTGPPAPPPPSSTSSTPSSSNTPLIIGAAVGGVVLLLLLSALLYVFLRRRKARVERRTTFHRNRMVKSLPPPTFAVPRDAELDSDDEKGYGVGYGSRSRYVKEQAPTGAYPFARTV